MRLTGELDAGALQAAVRDVLARHEVLRTIYPEIDGHPFQQIVPVADAALEVVAEVVTEDDLLARVGEVVSAGFDVTSEIPLRVALFTLSDSRGERSDGEFEGERRGGEIATDHVLVFVAHHISADGWSMAPLTRDVMTAYVSRAADSAPGWAPLPVQYADFALWQRAVLGSEDDPQSVLSAQAEFWKRTLAGVPDELNLPMDRPRPSVQSFTGGKVEFALDASTHRELAALARRTGTTMFMVLHTALAVFLARMSDSDDITIGTPIAGRGESELDDLIGMFVNTLVLRSRVDAGDGFEDLLARVRGADLEAFAHADIPFERLVEVLNPERSTARHPLFQVVLSFENMPETALELPGLRVSGVPFELDIAKFDLGLTLREHVDAAGDPDGLSAEFSYASALFDHTTVERFAERFTRLVNGIVSGTTTPVGDLPLLGDEEFAQLTRMRGHDVLTEPKTLADFLTIGVTMDPTPPQCVTRGGRSPTARSTRRRRSSPGCSSIGESEPRTSSPSPSRVRTTWRSPSWPSRRPAPHMCRWTPRTPPSECGTCCRIPVQHWVSPRRSTPQVCPTTRNGSSLTTPTSSRRSPFVRPHRSATRIAYAPLTCTSPHT